MPQPVVHILTPHEKLSSQLSALLGKGVQVSTFSNTDQYRESFHEGIEDAYRHVPNRLRPADEGGTVPPSERPHLLVVDAGSPPDGIDRRILVEDILRWDLEQEILLLVEPWRTDRIGYLMCLGAGSIIDAPSLFNPKTQESAESGLGRHARRLINISIQRRVAAAKGANDPDRDLNRPVFLSQSNDTVVLAFGIRRFVEMGGNRVWYWKTDGAEKEWGEPLVRALREARVLVALVSKSWLESDLCQEELDSVDNEERSSRRLLPILADPELRTNDAVRRLLSRWPAPFALGGIGAQVAWARQEVEKIVGSAGGPP